MEDPLAIVIFLLGDFSKYCVEYEAGDLLLLSNDDDDSDDEKGDVMEDPSFL